MKVASVNHLPNRHITSQSEVFGLQNFIGTRVIQDGLSMDTGLVRKRAIATGSEKLSDRIGQIIIRTEEHT